MFLLWDSGIDGIGNGWRIGMLISISGNNIMCDNPISQDNDLVAISPDSYPSPGIFLIRLSISFASSIRPVDR